MKIVTAGICLLMMLTTTAQKREEMFDFYFRPTTANPYYYVTTEKQDTLWHRKVYYISRGTMATEGWYKDDSCKVPHGRFTMYDFTGYAKEDGYYSNGKKEGLWLSFSDKGFIVDSGIYANGHLKGIELKWYPDGMPSDSLNFDGAGNGVEVSWYTDGTPASAGFWTQDTMKKGRWKYFFHDGSIMATEEYDKGKLVVCNCFTPTGQAMDTALCREKEAIPGGGLRGWRHFLETGLRTMLDNLATKGAKPGSYTAAIKFLVTEDGTVTELVPLTKLGQGIEEEIVKLFKNAPKWEPGRQFGRPVKSYHTQPVTFMITEQ